MSADFSVEHSQNPADNAGASGDGGKKRFGAFSLKKKKGGGGDNDSDGDLQVDDAFNDNNTNDFADYTFDDPVVDLEGADPNATGSMGDIFGSSHEGGAFGGGEDDFNSATGWEGGRGVGRDETYDYDKEAPNSRSGSGSEDDEDDDDDDEDYSSRSGSRSGSGEEEGSQYSEEEDGMNGFGDEDQDPQNMRHLDSMVEQGNWDGVMASNNFDNNKGFGDDLDDPSGSRPSLAESEASSQSQSSADEFEGKQNKFDFDLEGAESGAKDDDDNGSQWSYTSEDVRRRSQYRGQVESLVRKVVPDEIDNISAMMDQVRNNKK